MPTELKDGQPPRIPAKTIVLVGLMGTGKTTVGQALARRLGLSFFDLDHEIEKIANCTVSNFFSLYGEKAFRQLERQTMGQLLDYRSCIIASGGGTFIDNHTRARIAKFAISIWLNTGLNILAQRLAQNKGSRPLLKDRNILSILQNMCHERNPVYSTADITIDTGYSSVNTIVDSILKKLTEHNLRTNSLS